jgi:hypothetical protein
MAQRVVVVTVSNLGMAGEKQTGVDEVNKFLSEGWAVKDVHQMTPCGIGGGAATHAHGGFACLVTVSKPS